MANIGKYRRARLIDRGYAVRVTDKETNEVTWIEVASALHITSPFRTTILTLANKDQFPLDPNGEIFSRTPGEVRRVAEREAAEAAGR